MKKLSLILFVLCAGSISAKDILTLKNNLHFEGTILSIKDSATEFQTNNSIYEIPFSDISSLIIEDTTSEVYSNLLSIEMADYDPCTLGTLDAERFHGKKGAHFVLGMLFGPFAMIGTAICEPTPDKGKETPFVSENKNYFSDPLYLSCYKKKAKSQMLTFDALGWATWIALLLVL